MIETGKATKNAVGDEWRTATLAYFAFSFSLNTTRQ
jgi:hypothetical protein